MRNETIRVFTRNGIVAALYAALTILTAPISFQAVQIRLTEALVLLCFFRKDFTIGLTLGCFIANLFSPFPLDCIVGTSATLISCLLISFSKHLFIATLWPVIANGILVGAEIVAFSEETMSFWPVAGSVALGEVLAVCVFGYILFMILRKSKIFMNAIGANQNLEFKW